MIKLYTESSSASSRHARQWLTDHHLAYRDQCVQHQPITAPELKQILSLTTNGISDIISNRSRIYKKLARKPGFSFDNLSLSQFINFVIKNPSLLHWPIMINRHQLVVGYNTNEIRCFLPHKVRIEEMRNIEARLKMFA